MGKKKRLGRSYALRVADVNRIYDRYAVTGLSNREIWRRYIWPKLGISERTFYYMLKASARADLGDAKSLAEEGFLFPEFEHETKDLAYFRQEEKP